MKKISFAFDLVVIGALYSNIFPGNSIFKTYLLGGLITAMILVAIIMTISASSFKKKDS